MHRIWGYVGPATQWRSQYRRRGAEWPPLTAKKLSKRGGNREKERKIEKRRKIERKRPKSGSFIHFAPPDKYGWLRYCCYFKVWARKRTKLAANSNIVATHQKYNSKNLRWMKLYPPTKFGLHRIRHFNLSRVRPTTSEKNNETGREFHYHNH